MLADVQLLPPKCPECSRPMQLVHVYPPVRTFECAECETDAIWQWQPTPINYRHARQLRS
jgi:hypothetical protein